MEVKATTKGRIIVPAAIRRQLNIKPGTRIRIEVDEKNQRLILTPIVPPTPEFIHSLRGKYKGQHMLERLMEDRRIERDL